MTPADVGNLHVGHGPGNDDLLVAPVKLECLAGLEYEWDVGVGRTSLMFCPPVLHKTTHAIVSTAVTFGLQCLVVTLRCTPLLQRQLLIALQQRRQCIDKRTELGSVHRISVILEVRLITP